MVFAPAVKPPRRRKSDRIMDLLHRIYRATGAALIVAMLAYVIVTEVLH